MADKTTLQKDKERVSSELRQLTKIFADQENFAAAVCGAEKFLFNVYKLYWQSIVIQRLELGLDTEDAAEFLGMDLSRLQSLENPQLVNLQAYLEVLDGYRGLYKQKFPEDFKIMEMLRKSPAREQSGTE